MKTKYLSLIMACFCIICGATVSAAEFKDYDFEQERMLLTTSEILIISSFENEDHISSYSYGGTLLWDSTFHAKIVSWRLAGDYLFVFSKSRKGYKTYLTCLDVNYGTLIWQRP